MSSKSALPQFDQQLRLHVTGCPNGCGQHWIADIGIEGKKIKHEGKLTDAYYFCLGGAVGQHANVARPVGYRCAAPLVPEAIERLLRALSRRIAILTRIFAHGLPATPTMNSAPIWPVKFLPPSSAICQPAACPCRHDERNHRAHRCDLLLSQG